MHRRASHILLSLAVLAGCSSGPAAPPAADAGFDAAPDAAAPDAAPVDAGPVATDARADAAGDAPNACGYAGGTRCNAITNQGCQSGYGCYLATSGGRTTTACQLVGARGWGEACGGSPDMRCREGFGCIGTPPTCQKLCCDGDNATCRDAARGGRAGARCALTLRDVPGLAACVEDSGCDPFATTGNGCPAATPRCEPLGDSARCSHPTSSCATPGADGARCCDNGCCQVGFLCAFQGSPDACNPSSPNGVCRKTCRGDAAMPDAQCPTGQACSVSFNSASGLPDWFRACAPRA